MSSRGNFLLVFVLSIVCFQAWAQEATELEGVIIADKDLEGIHVINKSLSKFATTDAEGKFNIPARFNDTILVTSIQYKPKQLVISFKTIADKRLTIRLEEQVNVLSEVIVGRILTGDLSSDIENSDAKRPLAFYDVGLPGYTGVPKTQNERRLFEADGGYWFNGLSFNVHKLLNRMNGRTKMLRERVRLETNDVILDRVIAEFSQSFFETNPLDEKLRAEFFYFCSEDANFRMRCQDTSSIEVLEFLNEKYDAYLKNLRENQD